MSFVADAKIIATRLGKLRFPRRQFSKKTSNEADKPTVNIPSTEIVTPFPPLSEPLPDLPKPIYANVSKEEHQTKVTTLANGLKVASQKRFGQFCTIGVVIDSGCRYEVNHMSGVSHFLEKLAFGSTREFKNRDQLLSVLEKHGGICDCQSSRDTFVYATSADSRGIDGVTKVLGEVVLRPQISEQEVEGARQTVKFELETLLMRPEQEPLLMDMIHAAAYKDNTLGLPKICPEETVDKINRDVLLSYLKQHYSPSRMVVAGVGVEHNALVEQVQKYFVEEPAIWEGQDIAIGSAPDNSKPKYTGGIITEDCNVPLYPGSDLPELSHIVIGLEGCSHQDEDFIAMCVLNMMMGGGGSFSAGGPGKGMYTRLYTNVLNRYHWMFNATAYNHAYGDTGLFCIHASAPPPKIGDTVDVLLKELVAMAGSCNETELRRAKTQLQSMLLMNLEARPVVFEDIARQVLATGDRKPPQYFIDAIELICGADIQRVARRILSSEPCVAARGVLTAMPKFKYIQDGITRGLSPMGRLSLFR